MDADRDRETQDGQNLALNRRSFLALGLVGAGAVALSACGSPSTRGAATGTTGTSSTGATSSAIALPEYTPPPHVTGAMISSVDGVPPAYLTYPVHPFRAVSAVPGNGSAVTTFQINWVVPPPPLSSNPWWQALDKRLNVKWQPLLIPYSGYDTRLATILASGDIPDITFLDTTQAGAVNAIQQGAFTDLSATVSGKNIRKYSNLAHIPTVAWKNSAINGKLYGVPNPVGLINTVFMYREDWAAKLGHHKPPADAAEFLDLMVGFAKGSPAGKGTQTWAIADLTTLGVGAFVNAMFRVPNNWSLSKSGKLTSYLETPEFESALQFLRKMWSMGVFYPNALGTTPAQATTLFETGHTGWIDDGPGGIFGVGATDQVLRKGVPGANPQPMIPPGHNGGAPLLAQTPGFYGICAIPASVGGNAARLHELLDILNYWAAPFGSSEYLFVNYGLKGVTYTLDATGNPVVVSGQHYAAPMNYGLAQPAVYYFPGAPQDTKTAFSYYQSSVRVSAADPTAGYISKTAIADGNALSVLSTSYFNGIVTGRLPMSALTRWRAAWLKQGGATIRREYEAALAAN